MFRIIAAYFILSLFIWESAVAQVYSTQYRVPGQNWQQLQTEQFRLIFPARYLDEAERALSILQTEYDDIRELIGGNLHNFTVILNPENDRSNGFVSPFNFRSEVELAPIKGKALNPASGDWLEAVLPHELVHALHFSINPSSVTSLLTLFSPDMRRSVHLAAPLGLHEGIAVHYESHGSIPGSGRGNYPWFTHQFNSLLDSSDPWSMGQLFHTSDYSLPFNRHYVGGYQFTHWLIQNHSTDSLRESIEFHYRWPLLGYGMALRNATGYWPSQLYRQFMDDAYEAESDRLSELSPSGDTSHKALDMKGSCRQMARPLWSSNTTILLYGRFCNRPSGFYLADLETHSVSLKKEVVLSEDYIYNYTPDSTGIYFSRYHTDTLYDNLFRGDVHLLATSDFTAQRITTGKRVFSPHPANDGIYTIQTDGQRNRLVKINTTSGAVEHAFEMNENGSVIQVAKHPAQQTDAAIIGNVNGVQAVWFEDLDQKPALFNRNPDIVFESGSIFDISWHPTENRLLFVTDFNGSMNLYEFDKDHNRVIQLTDNPFNSVEPSYSPNGGKIAYIRQQQNELILHTFDRDQASEVTLPDHFWMGSESAVERLGRPLMNRSAAHEQTVPEPDPYRTRLSWLKPRLWLPEYEKLNGYHRWGVNLQSVDPMSRHMYDIDLSHYIDRLWYNLEYTYKGFYPGFRTNVYNQPSVVSFRTTDENNEELIYTALQQSRGGSLKVPFRIYLDRNARFSSLLLEPQYYMSQLRFLNIENSSESISDFGTRHTLGFRTVLNLNLRQFRRDVQPNRGWVLFGETRYDLNRDEFQITTPGFQLAGNMSDRKGIRGGISTFVSPLSRFNQSLRLTGQIVSQTDIPVFNTMDMASGLFADNPAAAVNNAGIFDTRYTIPITYPDDGGLLLPVYLSNIYLVLFSQTVTDLDRDHLVDASRTVYGAGIRSRFRLSNLLFDLGISIGYEPTRNNITYHFGSF
jgi:hypothetical protein